MTLVKNWVGVGLSPTVFSAVAGVAHVRVNFSEAMTNNALLLATTSYVFAPGGGSVAVTALTVTPESTTYPSYVDVTLNAHLTIGTANYTLTVNAGLEDKAGNIIDPAGLTAIFNGVAYRATFVVIPLPASLSRLRVIYSWPVKQVNPANADDALHLANYSVTAGVIVTGVATVSSTEVEVTLSGQEYAHTYTMAIANVEDVSNNEVA